MNSTWVIRIIAGLLLSYLIYIFYPTSSPNPRPFFWEIQNSDQGVHILGIRINTHNLQDAMLRLQGIPTTALFTKRKAPGEPEPDMHLEAYFEDIYDEGDRFIFGLNADEKLLQHIKKQGIEPRLYPDGVLRINIHPDLATIIQELPIHSITIIPGHAIDFEEFQEHMGKPDNLINDGVGNAHFLYPKLGLDFIQPAGGTQVLQFVAPEDFEEKLAKPLIQSLPQGAI